MPASKRRLLTWSLLAPSALAAAVAHAQSADPEAERRAKDLDGVVVVAERAITATKTDTAVVDTPQAISVVAADLFADRGALNLQETLRYSAGVAAEAYGLDTRSDAMLVRGLAPVEFHDGMRKVYNYSPLPRVEVYSLDRVELLRGPSSVLYGQGASGGIVNSVSKLPQPTFQGEVGAQFGRFDRKQLQFDVTGALNEAGTVYGRLVGVGRDSGMQTDGVSDDRLFLSPSITWDIGTDTRLTLLALYQRDRTASSQQFLPVAATLQAPPGRRLDASTFLGDADVDKLDARQASLTALFEHRFADALTWRSSLRYVDAETTFQELYPDTYSNPADPFIDAGDRLLNRIYYAIKPDLRILTSDNSLQWDVWTGGFRHKLLFGVDYSDFRQRSWSAGCDATADPGVCTITPIDIYDPVSRGIVLPAYQRDPNQRNTQVGLYAQDQIDWGERLSLVLGLRRDRARSRTQGSPVQTDEATTYRIGVIGDAGAHLSPYVSYSESFLPVAGLDFYNNALQPQRGRQVEAGVKWNPARNALVTANVFRIVETNRPTNDPDNPVNVVQTGELRSRGFELEAAYAFGPQIELTASYAYNDAEVTRSNYPAEIGVQLGDVPKHLASLWASKRFELGAAGLRLGLGGRYVGSTLSTGAAGSLRTPSYTVADALAAVEWSQWSFALNVTNLFDKEYFAPCRVFGDCFTGLGRNVVGTVRYRF